MHEATRSMDTAPNGMLQVAHHRLLPIAFGQVAPTILWYPFIQLGGERHYELQVIVLSKNRTQWSVLKLRPLNLESSDDTNHTV